MKIIKVPLRRTDLSGRIIALRSKTRAILNQFCIDKVRESKLSTSSFSYEFDLAGKVSLATQKKSVQRLVELLYKSVKKQTPYVEYMKGGEMFNTSRITAEMVKIKLMSPYIAIDFAKEDDLVTVMHRSKWYRGKRNYFRYLNREAVKFGLPIQVTTDYETEVHPDDHELYSEIILAEKTEDSIRARFNLTVYLNVGYWVNTSYQEFLETEAGYGINTHEEYLQTLGVTERDPYNPDQWTFYGTRYTTYHRGQEKFMCMEKLFVVLDKLQKVLKTFSRITTYDTAAFTIGSEQPS